MGKAAKPTPMQAEAMEYIRQGDNPVKAMRKAGYSRQTAKAPKQNLLSTPGAQSLIEQYKIEYARVGITPQYMAAKTAQWLEAQKPIGAAILVTKDGRVIRAENEGAIEVDDFKIQIEAAKLVRQDWGLGQDQGPSIQINNLIAGKKEGYDL